MCSILCRNDLLPLRESYILRYDSYVISALRCVTQYCQILDRWDFVVGVSRGSVTKSLDKHPFPLTQKKRNGESLLVLWRQ